MNLYSLKIRLHILKKRILPIQENNTILSKRAKRHNVKYNIIGEGNSIDLGISTLHNLLIYVRGNNNKLVIEKGCYLKNTNLMFEGNNCCIKIGENTTIEGAHIDVKEDHEQIIIEKNCTFSYEIYISTSDSHSILINCDNKRINNPKSVHIYSNVWLGKRVMGLKGTSIGSGTIVAAASIVTGTLDAHSIYAGSPVKKIKGEIHGIRERI